MTLKIKLSNVAWHILQVVLLLNIFFLTAWQVNAQSNENLLQKIAQLQHHQNLTSRWQQLVANPSNKNQFFIINDTGQMYLVDEMKQLQPILDLLSINQDKPAIKLTAFELHPNFSLRDQPGYGTFYTAHLENIDEKISTKRLQEKRNGLSLKFDAVVTEWQFNSVNYQQVDLNSKREVLRVGVPENSMIITQLSFNPYIKSWNDDFGLLYIALNGHEQMQEPLYSGVLLRINPAKFGLRSFTVPTSNPYIMEKNIKDEIFLLGGNNIKQFVWSSKSSDEIVLSHYHQGKYLLSLTKGKNDWREKSPENTLLKSNDEINDTLLYLGSNLSSLRNSLLLLMKKNNAWSIEAITVTPSLVINSPAENTLQPIWQFNEKSLPIDSEIELSQNFNNELIILDKNNGTVFDIVLDTPALSAPLKEKLTNKEPEESPQYTLFILLLLIAAFIAVHIYKRNKLSAKAIVRKQFAHIELSESQQQMGFYHRHQKSTDTIIELSELVCCEIKLNDHVINVIDSNDGNGFDESKEQQLRDIFAKEKVDKMVEGKIRQINITFTGLDNNQYIVCLYMRKGSDRVTKKSYSSAIDEIIDWCWVIAKKMNPEATPKRKKKIVSSPVEKVNFTNDKQHNSSLHEEAAVSRQSVVSKSEQNIQDDAAPVNETTESNIDSNEQEQVLEQPHQKQEVNTDLVNALEKLVDLKQQGYLTQAEFIKAKENLMRSLFE